jgi:predicted metal-dependent HD superfamily phosphohydrolase
MTDDAGQLRERLRAAWHDLLRQVGTPPASAEAVFEDLAARYAGPGRFYHTLDHLSDMLETIDRLCGESPATAVRLAAWFHDAVYDSRASDNEERSAALAGEVLARLGLPAGIIAEVQRLVLLTRTHQAAEDDPDGQVLLDADLAILGSSECHYDAYARAIRQEYAWVPQAQYREGRTKVLRGFLARERIYRTRTMTETHEAAARANLRREIEALSR